ncbi:MAG: EAL domain-containing protein, partial [Cyanobacteria bacterium P01_G01_bin.4]
MEVGTGSAGNAWSARKPQFLSMLDPSSKDLATLSSIAIAAGAIAELSIPVIRDSQVLAVSTFYYQRPPQPYHVAGLVSETIQSMTQLLISERQSLEQQKTSSQALFDSLMGLYCVTAAGQFVNANTNLARIYGYESADRLMASVQDVDRQLYVQPQRHTALLDAIEESGLVQGFESEVYCRDGSTKWISETARAIRDANGRLIGCEGAVEDITARKRDREMIEFMAYYDVLTGLANRMLFHDRLTQAISNAHRSHDKIAVLFIDVDRFKTINDSLGHSVGDALLQEVTERLKSSLGEGDTLARWGGDEFALLTPFTQAGDAAKQARALLESLEKQMMFSGQPLHVTASIGIALYPTDGDNAQALMQNAGTALHRAKDLGRNTYQFYNAAMNAQATTRLSLENDLRMALQREQLQLYYQPQIDTHSGKVLGFEALLRWNHPKLGLLLPNRFIPIAEESGLITVMTDWILTAACRQMCRWHQMGFSWLHVAVNLSAREFQQPQLLSLVSQVLEKTGLPPRALELEITESVAMQDANRTIRILSELRKMGVLISIDDFGTGYSSISYLRQFPCDTLKIDRSFIADLGSSDSADLIGRSVISLGQGLNLKVVAEGVETPKQLEFLKQANCDSVQGFWFSRPAPASVAEN